ncbi:thioredoxin 1 [Methylococcus capsulatus]|jgi:thioredoxin 1|uniref:Thioredoxin n=1 Tax=Methylococcus capsulatus TaxID=414 RepID=A0AA35Y0C0_METCP|nr:thioredoxin 1 [Methylococcus capsulatus]
MAFWPENASHLRNHGPLQARLESRERAGDHLRGAAQVSSDKILHVTDAEFEDKVLKAPGPVLVDYWAEWCGPCKMIAPILDEIAGEYEGRLTVAKLNIDDNPATPQRYGVRGIPTLMVFKGGEVVASKVGALTKSQLAAFLEGNM